MIARLCIFYLKLLEATARIEVRGQDELGGEFLAGFWHEDSLAMNLLLRRVASGGVRATAVITADKRGDAIQRVIRACGGEALRLSYNEGGMLSASRQLLSRLRKKGERAEDGVGTALDGPLGPFREPKKFIFLLACKAGRRFVGVSVRYKRKIRLGWRWDKYVLPLPFGKLYFECHDFGQISPERLDDFHGLSSEIRSAMLGASDFRREPGRVEIADECA